MSKYQHRVSNTRHPYKSQVLDDGRSFNEQLEACRDGDLSAPGATVREVTGALAGNGRFMSDVYSFGVVVWEVLSRQVRVFSICQVSGTMFLYVFERFLTCETDSLVETRLCVVLSMGHVCFFSCSLLFRSFMMTEVVSWTIAVVL